MEGEESVCWSVARPRVPVAPVKMMCIALLFVTLGVGGIYGDGGGWTRNRGRPGSRKLRGRIITNDSTFFLFRLYSRTMNDAIAPAGSYRQS